MATPAEAISLISFLDGADEELLVKESQRYRKMGEDMYFYQIKERVCGDCAEVVTFMRLAMKICLIQKPRPW